MSNYDELVKALRCGNTGDDECGSSDCPYWSGLGCMDGKLCADATAAIEDLEGFLAEAERDRDEYMERMEKEQKRVLELQSEVKEQKRIAAHYEQEAKDYWKEACDYKAQIPKKGEWIEESYNNQNNLYRCSVCGLTMLTNTDYVKKHNYCYGCGAKMGVQE